MTRKSTSKQHQRLLELLGTGSERSNENLAGTLGVTLSTVTRYLRALKIAGKVKTTTTRTRLAGGWYNVRTIEVT